MLKFTNNFSNTKLVLVRRHIINGSCPTLIVMRAQPHQKQQIRFYDGAPKQQTTSLPPPRAAKSRKLYYGIIGTTLLTGAAVVYAKNSPEARSWLESNIPWADDLVALAYQENTTYWKFSVNQFNKITAALSQMFKKKEEPALEFPLSTEKDFKTSPPNVVKEEYKSTVIQTEKSTPEPPPTFKITKNMVDVEHEMHENTKLAIDKYKEATNYCSHYNKALNKVVESSVGDLDKKYFTALQNALLEKDKVLEKAKAAAEKAKSAIDNLDNLIASGVEAPPDSVAVTMRHIKQFRADLERAEDTFKAEEEKSVLSKKYWNKVEAARNMYRDELQALFPGIDLSARKLEIKGDTDLLLLYTLKQVQFLQNELAELQTVRELKINRALDSLDEKAIVDAKVEDMVKAERIAIEKEYQKKAIQLQAEANRNLREQLLKQVEIQQEVQRAALIRKEKEVLAKFNHSVSEALEKERVTFKKDLAMMAGKLMAIETTLKQRAKAESEARRSQSLWAAAEALLAATRRPAGEIKNVSVKNEIQALEKAGKDDKLVDTILKGISGDILEKGVATEKALRSEFDQMEKTAAKVALVGREGAALPVYFLSWLQSKLLFQQLAEIPKEELDNLPVDFSKLDTFDIIHRARYHVEHGDLTSALRYVNLLQGGARVAAKPWLEAAKRHLEVKQAAEALMAHASVSGLLYL